MGFPSNLVSHDTVICAFLRRLWVELAHFYILILHIRPHDAESSQEGLENRVSDYHTLIFLVEEGNGCHGGHISDNPTRWGGAVDKYAYILFPSG